MVEIYGTTSDVPGDQVTVRSGGTVAVSAAFNTSVGLVGGYDAANGDATEGEVTTVESSTEAANAFGEDSELKRQVDLAFRNGAGVVYAAPVSETQTTESVAASASTTLTNAPLFDPRVNEEHSIDITDTTEGATVETVLVDGTPTQPSDANTAEVNPTTGEVEFDESSDYDVTYSYGDYTSAIDAVASFVPRSLGVLTESTDVADELLATLNEYDPNFDFMHGYVGEYVDLDDLTNYSNTFDDRRLALVSASRGYTDTAETTEVRTVGAVAGKQSGKELGDTTTAEDLSGIVSLKQSPTNTQADTMLDAGVYPLQQRGGVTVVKDRTTSTDPRFERVAWSEIVDETAEISHTISRNYVGEANTGTNRLTLAESHRSAYAEMESDDLLDDFLVAVSEGADPNTVTVDIGLNVVDYMDRIEVSITVGDVVTNGGAA